MLDEVFSQFVQTVISGNDLVILAEQFLQERHLVGIKLGALNGIGDAVV